MTKILVDELPQSCSECPFHVHENWRKDWTFTGLYLCKLTNGKIVKESGQFKRMNECPLEEIKTIFQQMKGEISDERN